MARTVHSLLLAVSLLSCSACAFGTDPGGREPGHASDGAPDPAPSLSTGGAPGTGGASTATGGTAGVSTGGAPAQPPPACVHGVTASQVVMIGDSFYHITEIPQDIWENARAAGTLGATDTYRHYYLSGAMMSEPGLVTAVVDQYDQARVENPDIVDIVMNGGGNDVLIRDRSCLTQAPPANTGCAQTIDGVVADARALFARMGQDGVKHVVYAFYPHMPTFGLFQGYAPAINETIDYAQELARKACEESVTPKCYFVSTREAFEGHADYLNPGDVHASPAGSKVAADLIWSTMVDHCVAQ